MIGSEHGSGKAPGVNAFALTVLVAAASLLTACSDNDSRPRGPQEFQATLTDLNAVKKGSDETLPVADLPAESATLTLDH